MRAAFYPGYNNRYIVCEDGRVFSYRKMLNGNVYGIRLKPADDGAGYLVVAFCKNGKPRSVRIHRLLAELFVPNPNNLSEVNHIDGNKRNNSLSNLEWCTTSDNVKHAFANGLACTSGSRNGQAKLDETKVRFIRDNAHKLTLCELATRFGISIWAVSDILAYRRWKHVA